MNNEYIPSYEVTSKIISYFKQTKVLNKVDANNVQDPMYDKTMSDIGFYTKHFAAEGKKLIHRDDFFYVENTDGENKSGYKLKMLLVAVTFAIKIDGKTSLDIMVMDKGNGLEQKTLYNLISNSGSHVEKTLKTVDIKYVHGDYKSTEKVVSTLLNAKILLKNDFGRIVLSNAGQSIINDVITVLEERSIT